MAPEPDATSEESCSAPHATARTRRWRRSVGAAGGLLLVAYLATAYVIIPYATKLYYARHPSLDDVPGVTQTSDGHPGDPLNVALIGTEAEVKQLLEAAQWHPADPLGLRSDLGIAAATVLRRPYEDAPVSNLFLWGRKEDLAFEQPAGDDPRKRHHVRFWRSEKLDPDGRPVWVGAATYDERVGLSHTTGQVTHHIAPDVDVERDHLIDSLKQTGRLSELASVDQFHLIREGRNGGGDPWRTDGRLLLGVIRANLPSAPP
ncbi:MAG: LssY C-terminal domain-containing protein [Pirellulales bacterium]